MDIDEFDKLNEEREQRENLLQIQEMLLPVQ
jgi:hypothetical protein